MTTSHQEYQQTDSDGLSLAQPNNSKLEKHKHRYGLCSRPVTMSSSCSYFRYYTEHYHQTPHKPQARHQRASNFLNPETSHQEHQQTGSDGLSLAQPNNSKLEKHKHRYGLCSRPVTMSSSCSYFRYYTEHYHRTPHQPQARHQGTSNFLNPETSHQEHQQTGSDGLSLAQPNNSKLEKHKHRHGLCSRSVTMSSSCSYLRNYTKHHHRTPHKPQARHQRASNFLNPETSHQEHQQTVSDGLSLAQPNNSKLAKRKHRHGLCSRSVTMSSSCNYLRNNTEHYHRTPHKPPRAPANRL